MYEKENSAFRTDHAAEKFGAATDLNNDLSRAMSVRFEFEKKEARVNMRIPEPLLAAVRARQ